jgi:hypothetical protein
VFLVSLSLEPISHLTLAMHADTSLGIFGKGDFPWMVSLYDLMVIADIIDCPAMFPHYVKRRVHLGSQGFLKAFDELDLLGCYLKEGFELEDKPVIERLDEIILLAYKTEFDDYYLYKTGMRRKPAPKPQQEMPRIFRILLDNLEVSNLPGRVDAAMALLDVKRETRTEFVRRIGRARRSCKGHHGLRHVGVRKSDKASVWGISYVCGVDENLVESRLRDYCMLNKYRFRAKRWLGIGTASEGHGVCAVVRLDFPWTYDATCEEAVA